MVKVIYSVFLGLIIVTFVGVGVSTFYPSPEQPVQPDIDEIYYEGEIDETEEVRQARLKSEADWEQYDIAEKDYNRNVAIITMVISIALLYGGLSKSEQLAGISEGLLLGGILTLLYSIIRSLMSEDSIARFAVIAVGLVVALWLGNQKFPGNTKPSKSK